MTEPEEAPPSQTRLEQLGYTQQLVRRLNVPEVVGLAMADVSPAMAVLFLSAGVFFIGGTFSIGAGLILSVVVVLISLCLAELASMFPIAGGMYSLVHKVLPGPFSWITMFNYLIQGIVIPASIALGMVGFLKDLFPGLGLPDTVIAIVLLAAGHRDRSDEGGDRCVGHRRDGDRRVHGAGNRDGCRDGESAPEPGRGDLPSHRVEQRRTCRRRFRGDACDVGACVQRHQRL